MFIYRKIHIGNKVYILSIDIGLKRYGKFKKKRKSVHPLTVFIVPGITVLIQQITQETRNMEKCKFLSVSYFAGRFIIGLFYGTVAQLIMPLSTKAH